MKKSETASAVS